MYLGIAKHDDLISQIAIPPLHANISTVATANFKIEEVILGNLTKDIVQVLATLGIKIIFSQIDKGVQEIQILRRQNDVLTGYVPVIVGPIDPIYPKIALKAALEKQAPAPLDSFCKLVRIGDKVLSIVV